jgi:hypothetical protein
MTSEMDKTTGGAIGEDLKAAQIELYGVNDRPDLLPDTVSYYGLYRLATPRRALFFQATHKVVHSSGQVDDIDISFRPFEKEGDLRYRGHVSDQFSTTELDYVRNVITNYLKTDRTALHPRYRHGRDVGRINITSR